MNDFEVTTNNQEIVSIKVTDDLPSSIPNRSYVPTCTGNERLFLDLIKKKGWLRSEFLSPVTDSELKNYVIQLEFSEIDNLDFPGVKLNELAENTEGFIPNEC